MDISFCILYLYYNQYNMHAMDCHSAHAGPSNLHVVTAHCIAGKIHFGPSHTIYTPHCGPGLIFRRFSLKIDLFWRTADRRRRASSNNFSQMSLKKQQHQKWANFMIRTFLKKQSRKINCHRPSGYFCVCKNPADFINYNKKYHYHID